MQLRAMEDNAKRDDQKFNKLIEQLKVGTGPRPSSSGATSGNTYRGNSSGGQLTEAFRAIICWFCGERGHLSGQCMVRKNYVDDGKIIIRNGNVPCLPDGKPLPPRNGDGPSQKAAVDNYYRDNSASVHAQLMDMQEQEREDIEAYTRAFAKLDKEYNDRVSRDRLDKIDKKRPLAVQTRNSKEQAPEDSEESEEEEDEFERGFH